MAKYKFVAKNLSGKTIKGTKDATDTNSLVQILHNEGLYLLSCQETAESTKLYKLKPAEISDFCRQISTMLGSGITIVRALNILITRDINPRLKTIYVNLYKMLQDGNTLSEAMSRQELAFPELLVNMCKSGEASGQLEKTMAKMAVYYEKEHHLNNKIRTATFYPMILAGFLFVAMMAIFIFVLPKFFNMYKDMALPLATRAIIALSNFLIDYWLPTLIGVLILVVIWLRLVKLPEVRYFLDKKKLKFPILGKHVRTIYTARFARNLSSLYSSGLTMLNALGISAGIIGNLYITRQFPEIITKVRHGEMLSAAILNVDGFDAKLASTIFVGEETGKLDAMLESVADAFDYEAEQATEKMVSIIEPALIVIMAILVGTVMISVMLPIFMMYQQIG